MADRAFHSPETQGVRHVNYNFTVAASSTAANPATFVEGDKFGVATGSYVISSKVATGKYRFKTTNPFKGSVQASAGLSFVTPTGNTYGVPKTPVQNADGTWQVEVWVFTNSGGTFTLADLASGDQINVDWTLRNSSVVP